MGMINLSEIKERILTNFLPDYEEVVSVLDSYSDYELELIEDNCPEDINAVPAVFNGGTETNDGKCAHHAQRQCDVVANNSHHRSGQHCQNHKGCIEFLAVNRASV